MAETYNRTLVETKAAMLLIPQSARVLAKNREKGHGDEECCPPFDRTVDGLDSPRHLRSDRSPSSDSHLPCARLNARFPQQPWAGPLACEISIHQICFR